jgi:hypothetical protein
VVGIVGGDCLAGEEHPARIGVVGEGGSVGKRPEDSLSAVVEAASGRVGGCEIEKRAA